MRTIFISEEIYGRGMQPKRDSEGSRCVESKPDSDIKSVIGEAIDVSLESGQ